MTGDGGRYYARHDATTRVILLAFYLFLAFEVYRWIGEWVAGFYKPGR